MTTPPTFLDTGNRLLARVPVNMETGTVSGPGDLIGVLTLRSGTTTFTALLSADEVRGWSEVLAGLADSMTGGASKIVAASALDVAALSQQHREKR